MVYPSSGGSEDQDAQLTGSRDALAFFPCAKSRPKRNHRPEYARIWRRPRGGRVRDVDNWREPRRANPPGLTGTWVQTEGGKGGGHTSSGTVADTGTQHRAQNITSLGMNLGQLVRPVSDWVDCCVA